MWQYHNKDENFIVSVHSDFVKCSEAITGHEHAEGGVKNGHNSTVTVLKWTDLTSVCTMDIL